MELRTLELHLFLAGAPASPSRSDQGSLSEVFGNGQSESEEICEFGAGRPNFGGRGPRGEALGKKHSGSAGLAT